MIDLSPFIADLQGKSVAVFGLGMSGRAVVRALRAANVPVMVWDDDPRKCEGLGAEIVDLAQADLKSCACLVLAPGVSLSHPVAVAARTAGVEIIGDIEILHRCRHGRKVIGITGTNGKSTTTALVAHILKTCGVSVQMGGNIGRAVFDLELPAPGGFFVLELSSYQLDLCATFAPDIAVHLNLTPDHIDRHGSFEAYKAAKMRIFRGAGAAVVGVDDEASQDMAREAEKQRAVTPISVERELARGVFVKDGILHDGERCFSVQTPNLPGVHNHQNIAAAYAAARLARLEAEKIIAAVKTFPGLPHRQYIVRRIGECVYVNDSKATNADAAAKALACYDNIYWIAGGRPKEGGLTGLEIYKDRIRKTFLIGEAAADFARWFDGHGMVYQMCGTLEIAVEAAHAAARGKTATVLLSPACASFDQFSNFEARGNMFSDLVKALEEATA